MRISQTRSRFIAETAVKQDLDQLNRALLIRNQYRYEPQWVTDLLGPVWARNSPQPGGVFNANH